jgi:hypothetical protein
VAAGAALVGVGGTIAVVAAISGAGGAGSGDETAGGDVAIELPARLDVAGDAVWTPTGIDCATGQRLLLSASGEVEVEGLGGAVVTPDGALQFSTISPQPYASYGALIGRVGEGGMPFIVGKRLAMDCPADGALELGVNDPDPSGNVGRFVVEASDVTVDPTITVDALTPLVVEVPGAASEWAPTGITCMPGATYWVWATGTIAWGADQELTTVDASGTEMFSVQANDPSQNVLGLERYEHGSLIGAIDGLPPYVPLGTDSYFDCDSGGGRMGPLVLGVNDLDRSDNSGSFTVTVARVNAPTG